MGHFAAFLFIRKEREGDEGARPTAGAARDKLLVVADAAAAPASLSFFSSASMEPGREAASNLMVVASHCSRRLPSAAASPSPHKKTPHTHTNTTTTPAERVKRRFSLFVLPRPTPCPPPIPRLCHTLAYELLLLLLQRCARCRCAHRTSQTHSRNKKTWLGASGSRGSGVGVARSSTSTAGGGGRCLICFLSSPLGTLFCQIQQQRPFSSALPHPYKQNFRQQTSSIDRIVWTPRTRSAPRPGHRIRSSSAHIIE